MNKKEFLSALKKSLSGFPKADIEKSLDYYAEMIADRMEDGCSEEEAVTALGSIEEIRMQILSEIPLTRLVGNKFKPKRRLRAWEITMLVLGFPLWFPLLIVAGSLLFVGYTLWWVGVVLLYAFVVGLGAVGVELIISAPILLFTGKIYTAILFLGGGLIGVGLAIFCFFGAIKATKGLFGYSKKKLLSIKYLFVRKEETV